MGRGCSLRGKKAYLVIHIFLLWCYGADGVPLQNQAERNVFTEALLTSSCPYEIQVKWKRCPDAVNLKNMLDLCDFPNSCPLDIGPICLDTEHSAVYICSPKNVTCEAGWRRRPGKLDREQHNVEIIEERCPNGTYQPFASNCWNACEFRHRTFVPPRYVVHKRGDHISPTFVYCNYRGGFYNRDGLFSLDFDVDEEHTRFCTHIDKLNPCPGNTDRFPLPNGTCTSPCSTGESRDDSDGFVCKPLHEYPQQLAEITSSQGHVSKKLSSFTRLTSYIYSSSTVHPTTSPYDVANNKTNEDQDIKRISDQTNGLGSVTVILATSLAIIIAVLAALIVCLAYNKWTTASTGINKVNVTNGQYINIGHVGRNSKVSLYIQPGNFPDDVGSVSCRQDFSSESGVTETSFQEDNAEEEEEEDDDNNDDDDDDDDDDDGDDDNSSDETENTERKKFIKQEYII